MDGIGFLPFGTAYAIATDISQPSVPLALAKFSRGQELEADFLGVQYLYKSGYDPNALVALLEKTRSIEASASGATSRRHKAYASHPQTQARISKAQNEIRTLLPEREYSVGANLEFDSLKNRLLAGTNSLLYPEMIASPVVLTSVAGNGAISMAEHAVMLMLMLARNAPRWLKNQAESKWERWYHPELTGLVHSQPD